MGGGPVYNGGISSSVNLGDGYDTGAVGDEPGAVSDYVWFDPIALYCAGASVSQADCSFFCNACSGVLAPTLVNLNELQGTTPSYPSFNTTNLEVLGLCQIFLQQMYSVFWSQQTHNPEGAGAPGAPTGSGPGDGGTVGG